MSRYRNEIDNLRWTNTLLMRTIYCFTVVLLAVIYGWTRAPQNLRVDFPPTLQSGGSLKPGEHYAPNIYAFAVSIWQQVNHWPENGEKDYGPAIYRMSPYLTPACQDHLTSDLNAKANAGELALRTRTLQPMQGVFYTEDRVVTLSSNQSWTVIADLQITESSHGIPVKDVSLRYPLRVVRYDVDPTANPFGLAIDCGDNEAEPERLNTVREGKKKDDSSVVKTATDVSTAFLHPGEAIAKQNTSVGAGDQTLPPTVTPPAGGSDALH